MTTLRDICTAFAPEYLERYPHLPLAHRQVLSAIQQCQSGHDGHSLYQCPTCGGQHRVNHSCGNRHCPQCQQHTTQQWLQQHLDKQLPGPHFLLTFTVPETLRPFIRSHQRPAYQAMFHASAMALKRLAHDERFLGTNLPGFTDVLHTWGRQLQYHPHIHSIVPGGGLSKDRAVWLPSRANFFVPVKALSPIYRAMFKEDMRQAGLLEQIDPQVWTIPDTCSASESAGEMPTVNPLPRMTALATKSGVPVVVPVMRIQFCAAMVFPNCSAKARILVESTPSGRIPPHPITPIVGCMFVLLDQRCSR